MVQRAKRRHARDVTRIPKKKKAFWRYNYKEFGQYIACNLIGNDEGVRLEDSTLVGNEWISHFETLLNSKLSVNNNTPLIAPTEAHIASIRKLFRMLK